MIKSSNSQIKIPIHNLMSLIFNSVNYNSLNLNNPNKLTT